jgi:hypothetical protein
VKSIHAVNKNHSRWIELLLSQALSVFPVVVMAGSKTECGKRADGKKSGMLI